MFLMFLKLSQLKIIFSSRGWKKKNIPSHFPSSLFFSPFISKAVHSLQALRKPKGELGNSTVNRQFCPLSSWCHLSQDPARGIPWEGNSSWVKKEALCLNLDLEKSDLYAPILIKDIGWRLNSSVLWRTIRMFYLQQVFQRFIKEKSIQT